jgi:hypothetical protein
MTNYIIKINLDNTAFTENPSLEVLNVLEQVIAALKEEELAEKLTLLDTNGVICGNAHLDDED